MIRDEWKNEYVRLAMASRFELSEADAREEADLSWEHWLSEGPADGAMPEPADIIGEDMFEWTRR